MEAVVNCESLCYIYNVLHKRDRQSILNTVSKFYHIDELCYAKCELAKCIPVATASTIDGWSKLMTTKGTPVTRRGDGEQRRRQEADDLLQMVLHAGGWRPNFSLTRAAQLVAGRVRIDTTASPAQVGRGVARLMGLSAQDFVGNDLIEAIATGIAQYERDSTILLITQLGGIAAWDGTGIWGLYFMSREFSRWLQRPFDDWEGNSQDRAVLQ